MRSSFPEATSSVSRIDQLETCTSKGFAEEPSSRWAAREGPIKTSTYPLPINLPSPVCYLRRSWLVRQSAVRQQQPRLPELTYKGMSRRRSSKTHGNVMTDAACARTPTSPQRTGKSISRPSLRDLTGPDASAPPLSTSCTDGLTSTHHTHPRVQTSF